MNVVDTAVRLAPVVVTLIVAIVGAQLWRIGSEKRKLTAETKRTDVDSAGAVGSAAIQLLDPYVRALRASNRWSNEMIDRSELMEDYIDRFEDWKRYVMRKFGSQLDPPPRRPDFGPRPAFHPLVDRDGDGKGIPPPEGDPR